MPSDDLVNASPAQPGQGRDVLQAAPRRVQCGERPVPGLRDLILHGVHDNQDLPGLDCNARRVTKTVELRHHVRQRVRSGDGHTPSVGPADIR